MLLARCRHKFKTLMDITKEVYEKRCLELARFFGSDVDCYQKLPGHLTDFFETVGFDRIRRLLIVTELSRTKNGKTRSQSAIARQYGMSRDQVKRIKGNCYRKMT